MLIDYLIFLFLFLNFFYFKLNENTILIIGKSTTLPEAAPTMGNWKKKHFYAFNFKTKIVVEPYNDQVHLNKLERKNDVASIVFQRTIKYNKLPHEFELRLLGINLSRKLFNKSFYPSFLIIPAISVLFHIKISKMSKLGNGLLNIHFYGPHLINNVAHSNWL